jgi:guanylate kinase
VPSAPVILVDSTEPTDLLISLGAAPSYPIERCLPRSQQILLISGVAGAGKSTLISFLRKSMPERLVFPTVTSTAPLAWLGSHNEFEVVSSDEFEKLAQAEGFVYIAALPAQKYRGEMKWGLLRRELESASASITATMCEAEESIANTGIFAVVEEHPLGVIAAKAAGAPCVVLHVTLPNLDAMDQRLRMSGKRYEEHQV